MSLIQVLAAEMKEKEAWRLGSGHFQQVVDCIDGIPEAYGLLDEDT